MAETSPQDRLQPFLLDRLTDEEPHLAQERPDRRSFSTKRYRESVLRDLTWLLNSKAHASDKDDLESFSEVANSVVNYGMRDLAGLTVGSATRLDIERLVRNAILQFEPRIVRHSLVVKMVDTATPGGAGNVLSLEIKGDIKLLPLPEPIFVKTNVDLETGHCELKS